MKNILAIALVFVTGCVDASHHAQKLHSADERAVTVGIVQREIRPGMSGAAVAEALGSPNIVTRDDNQRETWIYDKIATEASYSNSTGGVGGIGGVAGAPGATLLLGILSGNYSANAGASASTQRTLTVVIKFDGAGRVASATYHSSQF